VNLRIRGSGPWTKSKSDFVVKHETITSMVIVSCVLPGIA
jgi:hypothetical protein